MSAYNKSSPCGRPTEHHLSLTVGRERPLLGYALAPPPCTRTWEQLLAQATVTLAIAGSQLCGRVELLQGQTLGQDVGLRIRACVQLGSKQRERRC